MTEIAPAPTEPRLYTTQQVAEIFAVTPETVRDWINKGKLKGGKAEGNVNQYRVAYGDLVAFAKSHYKIDI